MSLNSTKRAGFILRLFSLAAFSCMVLFAGIVVVQNEELGKLLPPSTSRTLAILFGYVVAILTFNYALGLKGRNFMGWKNEALLVGGFIVVFIAMFLPHAFPIQEVVVSDSWIPFRSEENTHLKPNWKLAWGCLLALPLFIKSWMGIKSMPLWASLDKN